jgi:hypothetical protein
MHAKFGFQLSPSKQESAPSETGERCGNVRRTNPMWPMSESGQKPKLPHCNSNGRFTSINGHDAMRFKVMRFAAFTAPKSPTEIA